MSLVLQSTGGGQITIQEPATASNFTQTLPAATGTIQVSGNMPAFSAYQSSAQTLSSSTYTKIQYQTELWDTANAFDSTTNYRFTPQVAGYYQINSAMAVAAAVTQIQLSIYKNGTIYKQGANLPGAAQVLTSGLVYLNGTTDYVEIYAWIAAGQAIAGGSPFYVWVDGCLVRGE